MAVQTDSCNPADVSTQEPGATLEQTALGEGHHLLVTDNEMIEHPDIHQQQRTFQPIGDTLVSLTGLCHPGRVIVREDHRCGVMKQDTLDHLPGVNAGAVNRPEEQLFVTNQPMLIVQIQSGEHFP